MQIARKRSFSKCPALQVFPAVIIVDGLVPAESNIDFWYRKFPMAEKYFSKIAKLILLKNDRRVIRRNNSMKKFFRPNKLDKCLGGNQVDDLPPQHV